MLRDRHADFKLMVLLYVAPTGRWRAEEDDDSHITSLKKYSSSALEQDLVSLFEDNPKNVNRIGTGGETASWGTPHYTYVMVR